MKPRALERHRRIARSIYLSSDQDQGVFFSWLFVLFLRGSALLTLKRLDSIMKLDQKSKKCSVNTTNVLAFFGFFKKNFF